MILETLDCRLEADADPSSGTEPAQLSPPPSSLVSLFSTFLKDSTVDSILAHKKLFSSSCWLLLLLIFFVNCNFWRNNFRASSGDSDAAESRGKTFFLYCMHSTWNACFTVNQRVLCHLVPKYFFVTHQVFVVNLCASWMLWRHSGEDLQHLLLAFNVRSFSKISTVDRKSICYWRRRTVRNETLNYSLNIVQRRQSREMPCSVRFSISFPIFCLFKCWIR